MSYVYGRHRSTSPVMYVNQSIDLSSEIIDIAVVETDLLGQWCFCDVV